MWVKIFWVAPRRIFWWLVTVFAPGRFVHFALIYPAKIVDDGPMTTTHGGANAWADLGIVNVGAVPFDPSTIQVSVAIGNNNYPGHPATAINTVTGWMDGSQIYGSGAATAANLRTADGHMKMSAGQNLPIVETDQGKELFAAGDARAQENPDCLAGPVCARA